MKICVIGGGNIGTLLAAEFAHKGKDVVIHTTKPERWSDRLTVLKPDGSAWFQTDHFSVTTSMEEAVKDAEQIWVIVPAFLFPSVAEETLPFVRPGQAIFCVPGGGGAEFAFREHMKKGVTLCGLQRVHSIARLQEYGKAVYMLGRKPSLQLAAIPSSNAELYAAQVSDLLDLPCEDLDNYLVVTLTPSNPILHTTRIYSMFRNYQEGNSYDHNILFYEEWTDESSEMLLACDAELQEICRCLDRLDLHMVKSLKVHYESDTVEKMTRKIRSIAAFKGLTSPMKEQDGVWVPDYTSRYFTADFPYGLKIILDIGKLVNADVTNIERVWNWYRSNCCTEDATSFALPVQSVEELYHIYMSKE